jgi:glycosyltransferase involved in cell wall biosynthesis
MSVDLICLESDNAPRRERAGGLDIVRVPIKHRRGGILTYLYKYFSFIFISGSILAARSLRRRYDLVYVHNMPDILVLSSLVPRILGAKVVLDLHDPMPELMTTIFGLDRKSRSVRLMERLEKWSIALAHAVITVNAACKRIFASRSCDAGKITVVMNSPDESIFTLRPPRLHQPAGGAAAERFTIIYHGSLVERNGLDLAVEALATVRTSMPNAELRIYGRKTPFLERVLDDVEKRGLQDCVHYLGQRSLEDLVPEIEASDVGVIPNQQSAFADINTPTRIFEYLALGKPVIAPRTRGIQDYFGPDSLVFFEPGNSEDLARKLEYVFSHPGAALTTAERGQRVYAAHSWHEERQALLNVITRLLD